MWFLILIGAFTIAGLLLIVLRRLLGPDFPFLMWLALGEHEPKTEAKHPRVKSHKVGA